jgi:hypothetical protein
MNPPLLQSRLHVRDFPAWLPSMLVKELRQGLRTRGFVGTLVVFQLVMAIAMLPIAIPEAWGGASAATPFFWSVIAVQLLLVGPSRALGGLQQEADSRTLDLLLLTRLDAWGIVLGKWLALVAQSALLMVAMLPYAFVRWFAGSVDLLAEAQAGLALFAVSAVLTAGGLWASRVAKVLRVVLVLMLLFSAQAVVPMVGAMFGLRLPGAPSVLPSFGRIGIDAWLMYCNAAIVTCLFLLSAARNIAPSAVNHAPLGRLLALSALLLAPVLLLQGAAPAARGQLVFAGLLLVVVSMTELALAAPMMARHWRPWAHRGPFGRLGGVFLMPGWESALWFASAGAALWALCAALLPAGRSEQFGGSHLAWIALLGLTALAFPALLLSFFGSGRFLRPVAYLACLILMGGLTGVMVAWSTVAPKWEFLRSLVEVLPVASFLLSFDLSRATTATFATQGVFALGVLGLAFAQARFFATQVALYTAQELTRGPGAGPRGLT